MNYGVPLGALYVLEPESASVGRYATATCPGEDCTYVTDLDIGVTRKVRTPDIEAFGVERAFGATFHSEPTQPAETEGFTNA